MGRTAVDFGTCNTRIALLSDSKDGVRMISLQNFSKTDTATINGQQQTYTSIPSLISYNRTVQFVGREVLDKLLLDEPATFRNMKKYITKNLPLARNIHGKQVTFPEAGAVFLSKIIGGIKTQYNIKLESEEFIFTAPVNAFEHYTRWFSDMCKSNGIQRWQVLDEATAAAFGYDEELKPNSTFMVFDFGGGTLDVGIYRVNRRRANNLPDILGRQGANIGGTQIDEWLLNDFITRKREEFTQIDDYKLLLLEKVRKAKENLSGMERAEVSIPNLNTGSIVSHVYTRNDFERILNDNELNLQLTSCIDSAKRQAAQHGFNDNFDRILLVGGSSLIPYIKNYFTTMYGAGRVKHHRPLDAVAFGAVRFSSGADGPKNFIQHDYAIRHYVQSTDEYEYDTLFHAGDEYPSTEEANKKTRRTILPTKDNQEKLGIAIYEIAQNRQAWNDKNVMIAYDKNGNPIVYHDNGPDAERYFLMNSKNKLFINVNPAALIKEKKRFPASFKINEKRQLCITVYDNKIQDFLLKDFPIIQI